MYDHGDVLACDGFGLGLGGFWTGLVEVDTRGEPDRAEVRERLEVTEAGLLLKDLFFADSLVDIRADIALRFESGFLPLFF